tara:strand:- start:1552 stop:2157 length:606 start_codon:yes stop_codon:yes gene_type:complete
MIKQVDKHTSQLTGFELFQYMKSRFNKTDEEAIKSMKENNQDTSFYAEYKQAKEEKEKRLKRQRENLINGYSLTDPRVIAVSQSAEVTPEEAIELIIDEDWICLSDEEADERAEEYILESVWAFNPSFLSYHTDIDEEIFKLLQDKCEGSNDAILRMIKDKDYFVEDAINSDGRGHFISFYDGEEHEQYINNNFYYCYRIN